MERSAPSLWKLLFYAGIIALVFAAWLSLILGITIHIGPLAWLNLDRNPETRDRVIRYSIYAVILAALTYGISRFIERHFFKTVPENFAAVIEANNGHRIVSVARKVWVMPFSERMIMIDLRPRDLHFTHEAVTHDKLIVKLHVILTWQPYVEDLQMVLDANIQQEVMLKNIVQYQLTQAVSKKKLEKLQSNLRELCIYVLNLANKREEQFEGVQKYGIYLQEVVITQMDLPADIVKLSEAQKIAELRKRYGPTQPGVSAG